LRRLPRHGMEKSAATGRERRMGCSLRVQKGQERMKTSTEYAQRRRRRLKRKGLCQDCGRRAPKPKRTLCEPCLRKKRAAFRAWWERVGKARYWCTERWKMARLRRRERR